MERRAEEAGAGRSRTKVLIAEGDPALADLYRATLEVHGWQVDVVSNLAGLMEQLHRAPPAALLLSAMPDAGQVTALEQVRSLPGMESLVIVVLYDSLDHIDANRLSRLNVQAWLSKTRTTREKIVGTIAGFLQTSSRSRR